MDAESSAQLFQRLERWNWTLWSSYGKEICVTFHSQSAQYRSWHIVHHQHLLVQHFISCLSRGRSHFCLRHFGSREGRNRGPRRKLPIKLSSRLRVKQLQRNTNLQLLWNCSDAPSRHHLLRLATGRSHLIRHAASGEEDWAYRGARKLGLKGSPPHDKTLIRPVTDSLIGRLDSGCRKTNSTVKAEHGRASRVWTSSVSEQAKCYSADQDPDKKAGWRRDGLCSQAVLLQQISYGPHQHCSGKNQEN